MRIQHNLAAMNAYRNYKTNNSSLNKNLEKLSSGYKINRAGDDAAGLAISEKMRAQITGLQGAQKNAKDGISLVQTAEGALQEVHDMLNRMYSLAEQSANGTYDVNLDRQQLQKEVDSLRTEIDRIADSANFNGIALLDGSLSAASVSKVSGQDKIDGTGATPAKVTVSIAAAAIGGDNSLKYKFNIGNATLTTGPLNSTATSAASINNALATAFKSIHTAAGGTISLGGKDFDVAISNNVVTFTASASTHLTSALTVDKILTAIGLNASLNTANKVKVDIIRDDGNSAANGSAAFKVTFNLAATDATKLQQFKFKTATATYATGTVWGVATGTDVLNDLKTKFMAASGVTGEGARSTLWSAGSLTSNKFILTEKATAGGSYAGTLTTASKITTKLGITSSLATSVTVAKGSTSGTPSIGAKTVIDFTGKVGQDVWGAVVTLGKGSTASKFVLVEKSADAASIDADAVAVVINKAATAGAIATALESKISNNGAISETFNGVAKGFNVVANATGTEATAASAAGKLYFTSSEVGAQAYALDITVGGGLRLQIGDTAEAFNQMSVGINNMHAENMGIGDIDISTQNGAAAALDKIKDAINYVSDTRGSLGALQNRLDHTINNLSVMEENITDAESTIRDTDVAEEMMKYTKNNILNQAAQAMLAQANQQPQGVLQLLQ